MALSDLNNLPVRSDIMLMNRVLTGTLTAAKIKQLETWSDDRDGKLLQIVLTRKLAGVSNAVNLPDLNQLADTESARVMRRVFAALP